MPYLSWRLDNGERSVAVPSSRHGLITATYQYKFGGLDAPAGLKWDISEGGFEAIPIGEAEDWLAAPACILDGSVYYESNKDRWRTGYGPFSYFFPPDHPETGVPLMPLIIAPALYKTYDEFGTILEPLWMHAREALSNADRVCVIGYSFPPTDIRAIDLMRSIVDSDAQPVIEIVDIKPEPIGDRLISSLGMKPKRIKLVESDFSAWAG